jgi:hypothetical protein
MTTLMTAHTPPEIEAELRLREMAVEARRQEALDLITRYESGSATFEEVCRAAHRIVCELGEGHQERILGQVVLAAIRTAQ